MKWISVKERMPEEKQRVLMYRRDEIALFCQREILSGFFSYLNSDKNDLVFYDNCCESYYDDVSHWMPLPEGPKE